jgi:zinc transport system permease protein
MPVEWMSDAVGWLADATGTELFVVKGVLAILLVCTLCGMVGALVVGNRMAFFSDAMAHCAFAGVTLGYLSVLLVGGDRAAVNDRAAWVVPLVMVAFGVAVGVLMVLVREQTGLAHDTVIGVFFALAIGFGAMLFQVLQSRSNFNPEYFLFGNLVLIPEADLVFLLGLAVVVLPLFAWRYNQMVFASFNPTLARTRGLKLGFNNYLFIVILALVVNLSIKAVGALLINALLVVPAATAANLSRNVRQMFWLTVAFCLGAGGLGFALRNSFQVRIGGGEPVLFGPSGLIVVTSVGLFFASMLAAALWNRFAPVLGLAPLPRRGPHVHDDTCGHEPGFGQCP